MPHSVSSDQQAAACPNAPSTGVSLPAWLMGIYCYCLPRYVASTLVLVLLYPLGQAWVGPLLSGLVPSTHASLEKCVLISTLMFWLPVNWVAIKGWLKQQRTLHPKTT